MLTLFLTVAVTSLCSAQNDQTIEYVRTARFGKEIVYYGKNNEVLNGTFKIAESTGSYSEASFIDGKPDGKWMSYDGFGNLESVSTFEKGVGNGKGETYDQQGNVLNTFAYKNGEQHGEWIYRGKNGIYQTENYEEGVKTGKWVNTAMDYDGNLKSVTTEYYKNGEPTGTWEETDANGNLVYKKVYAAPKTYSETEYFDNGKLKSLKNFAEGKRNGKQESYLDNGFKEEESEYDNGLKVMLKDYHNNGKLARSVIFNANGRNGVDEYFDRKGMPTRKATYVDGRQNGLETRYHYNSNQKYVEEEYKNDVQDGIYKEYHANGDLSVDGRFVQGQQEGLWKYYDESGKLSKEIKYESGNKSAETKYD